MEGRDADDSTLETDVQEISMPPPPEPPIQVDTEDSKGEDADGPSAPNAVGFSSPSTNASCVKKTFAKILYQCELNIDPPEQDAKEKKDIMLFIADNLKMEYKFDGKSLFVFSPMNVTDNYDGNARRPEENSSPYSFSVEGIKTSENWDYGRYETNMMIQLKKRRRALVVVQAEPDQNDPEQDERGQNEEMETEMTQDGEKRDPFKRTFGKQFQSIAFGMVIAVLVGLAVALIYVDINE